MERGPREIWFHKEDNGLLLRATQGDETIGMFCSECFEDLTEDDIVLGMAWVYPWTDYGLEGDPFEYEQEEFAT